MNQFGPAQWNKEYGGFNRGSYNPRDPATIDRLVGQPRGSDGYERALKARPMNPLFSHPSYDPATNTFNLNHPSLAGVYGYTGTNPAILGRGHPKVL